MKSIRILVALLIALPLGAQTNDLIPILTCGEQSFTNARISLASPAYATISHEGGISQIALSNLPAEYQSRYGYNPTNAAAFLAAQRQRERDAHQRFVAHENAAAAVAGPAETLHIAAILDETTYGGIPLCAVHHSGSHQGAGTILVKSIPGPVSDFLHRYQKLKADINTVETTPVTATATGPNRKAARRAANREVAQEKQAGKAQLKDLKAQLSDMEKLFKDNTVVRACPTGQNWSGYEIWVCAGNP